MLLLIPMAAKEKARGEQSPYVAGVRAGGADPAEILTLAPGDVLPQQFDGLLLTGGADVDPCRYGEAPRASNLKTDAARDAMDFFLLERALQLQVPVFAICRGMQMLNVALGGSLYQDLVDDGATDRPHRSQVRTERVHEIERQAPGLLADLLPPSLAVNSLHHQAVRTASARLRVTARSSGDGIIEAMEAAFPYPWLLAVQWHPEELLDDPLQAGLFTGFVAAIRNAGSNCGHPRPSGPISAKANSYSGFELGVSRRMYGEGIVGQTVLSARSCRTEPEPATLSRSHAQAARGLLWGRQDCLPHVCPPKQATPSSNPL